MKEYIQVMAFDFGLNRIGVATGNSELKIPHPLETVTGKNKFEKLDKISELIEKWNPQLLVVGKPSDGDNKTELLVSINKFANRLSHRFNLPVNFVNEDYTSSLASGQLNEQNIFGRRQSKKLDGLAACAILETYFNNHMTQ